MPIVPDYLLNHCLEERCVELNFSSARDCQKLANSAADDTGHATPAVWRQTDLPPPPPQPTASVGQRGHVINVTSSDGVSGEANGRVERRLRPFSK